ncbi:MAG: ABC transporter substrate-binding protein [Candidatus Aenigmatarchaeota archaeon]
MENRMLIIGIGVAVAVILVLGAVLGPLTSTIDIDGSQDEENYRVEDATGEKVEFEESPERIVSFMPSNTELLFYLDLGERIVGVDDFSNHPPEVNEKIQSGEIKTVGDSLEVKYEDIVELEPDVVMITQAVIHMRETLDDYGIKSVVTGGETLENVYSDLKILGKMCGIEEEAEEKAQGLKEEMDRITKGTRDLPDEERVDVLYISGINEGINTPGEGTFQHTLLRNAGFNNIASSETGWHTIPEEDIIEAEPEVIIAPNYLEKDVEEYTDKESWQDIPAVENDDIFFVDGDIMSRPGPRVVEAQETLVGIMEEAESIETETETTALHTESILGTISEGTSAKQLA